MSTDNDNNRLISAESRCGWTDGSTDAATLRRNIALVKRLSARLRNYADKGVWDIGDSIGPRSASHCVSEARYNA